VIKIRPDYLETVLSILKKNVPDHEVWAFGSRVNGEPKQFSDLDLTIKTSAPLPVIIMANLRNDFSETNLPFKVDIIDWSRMDLGFQKIVQENFEIIKAESSNT
jgi:predicted nucleotidyltransferase